MHDHPRCRRNILRAAVGTDFQFQLFLGGMTSYLALPLFWLLWLAAAGFELPVFDRLPGPLLAACFVSMTLGQVVMVAMAGLALVDSGRTRMLPWVLTLPLYWPLGALAAWRAIAEVLYAPFYWNKTEHGLHLPRRRPAARRSGRALRYSVLQDD